MQPMPLVVTPGDLALRLALTVVAGLLIGINRDEHGRPAGLRTTLLVCLAASVAMIQANLLLPLAGRPNGSFVMLDLMRLPLGILSGMGFLGAAAIIRRGDLVQGVTTAATLWIVTVIGLCFGGGQLALGIAATVLVLLALWGLKRVEVFVQREHRATLTVTTDNDADAATEPQIIASFSTAGYWIARESVTHAPAAGYSEHCYELRWVGTVRNPVVPGFLRVLAALPSVRSVSWKPQGMATV
jgi:putative Mg2+ transporter-C (MgtC) family protein